MVTAGLAESNGSLYRRVYDSRHLQADCQEPGSAPLVIKYGLPLPFYLPYLRAMMNWTTTMFRGE